MIINTILTSFGIILFVVVRIWTSKIDFWQWWQILGWRSWSFWGGQWRWRSLVSSRFSASSSSSEPLFTGQDYVTLVTFVKLETKRGNMSLITSYHELHIFTILCSPPPKVFQPSNSDRVLCMRLVLHHPPLAARLHLRHHGRRPRWLLLQVQEQSDHCTIDRFETIMILGQHPGCRGLSTRRSTWRRTSPTTIFAAPSTTSRARSHPPWRSPIVPYST